MVAIVESADAAVRDVFDGASIMFGGFASAGSPAALIAALIRRGATGLTCIANNFGFGDTLDELCEARQVAKVICSFSIRATASKPSRFESLHRRGLVELELVPQGTFVERIRAGGAGLGGIYTPAGAGTILADGKEVRTIDGRDYLFETPLRADFAFIRASRADRAGNLVYRAAGRNFNPVMATAATVVIAEAGEIVERGGIDPDAVVTPGVFVDRLVAAAKECP